MCCLTASKIHFFFPESLELLEIFDVHTKIGLRSFKIKIEIKINIFFFLFLLGGWHLYSLELFMVQIVNIFLIQLKLCLTCSLWIEFFDELAKDHGFWFFLIFKGNLKSYPST